VTPKPGPHVEESRASAEFYTNKILMEFKKTDETQVKFANAWISFLKDLAVYIKKHHTTGVTWNPKGGDASSAPKAGPAKAGGPPPPPPGPPPPPADLGSAPAPTKGADTGALFAQLNKGGEVTAGLKKVTKDMKNKYDPNKPTSSVVPAIEHKEKAPAKATAQKKGTPKFELEGGKKWSVEWQENNNNLEISDTATNQSVYVYKCEKSAVNVKGKVNNIILDSCKRVVVIFTDAIATCEVINCTSVEIHCLGKVPAMAIDKCSGVQVHLSKTGLDTEIVTSKSDAMNVLIPDPSGSPDPIELPVPEQYKTLVKGSKLVTNTVEHSG